MSLGKHYSVLLTEAVDSLVTDPAGLYIDGTFGRGGHSTEILRRLDARGRVVAFDKDPEAVALGKVFEQDARFAMRHDSFKNICDVLELFQEARSPGQVFKPCVDGVLLDLGVSSPQLDDPGRGFSFMQDGPLDMRMDNSRGLSAKNWLAQSSLEEMIRVFRDYGEEKFATRIARAIVRERDKKNIETTLQLAEIVKAANPAWEKHKHPATRVFQAIRIAVNAELEDLRVALKNTVDMLKPGGRLVVISFHSLEDRIVKRFFRDLVKGKSLPKGLPVTDEMLEKKLRLVGKAVKASDRELTENVRSRSAVMRVAERLA